MQGSEEALLHAGEREEGHGGGDADIDADVSGDNLEAEVTGGLATAGVEAGSVAERAGVDPVDRRVEGRDVGDREDGAEDLGLGQGIVGLDPVEDGGPDKISPPFGPATVG